MTKDQLPDFIIVGPTRTGTTWLYCNLIAHPEFFLSKPKDLHYFCSHNQLRPIKLAHSDHISTHLSYFKDSPIDFIKKNIKIALQYGRLYNPKVRGEVSACYSVLTKNTISRIVKLNINIKIILMIRNPVMRAWSQAKLLFRNKNKDISYLTCSEIIDYFNNEGKGILRGGYYSELIPNWLSFVKETNLFLGIHEEIGKCPKGFLLNVYKFLNVKSNPLFVGPLAYKQINKIESVDIPQKIREFLTEIYLSEISYLNNKYNIRY